MYQPRLRVHRFDVGDVFRCEEDPAADSDVRDFAGFAEAGQSVATYPQLRRYFHHGE
jgi:hypothetical protein